MIGRSMLFAAAIAIPGTAQPVPDAIKTVLTDELRGTNTPGAAIAVVRDGNLVAVDAAGVANVESSTLVTAQTLFHVGSLTKLMTAAALLDYARSGKVDLQKPIGSYLTGLSPALARVTLHELLSQSSGLADSAPATGPQAESALAAYARTLGEKDFIAAPGRVFSYSNSGYSVAGAVLESVAKRPYADAMAGLFARAGMRDATFRPTMAMSHPLAVGHVVEDGRAKVVRPFSNDTRFWPAGYAYASITDLGHLLLFLLTDPASPLPMMTTRNVPIHSNVIPGASYGYGLFVRDVGGTLVAEHGGTMPGLSCETRLVPSGKSGVIVCANRDNARFRRTLDAAVESFGVVASNTPPATADIPLTARDLAVLPGSYSNRWTIDIERRGEQLFLKQNGTEAEIRKTAENRFRVNPRPGITQEFAIMTRDDGTPELLQMFVWAFKRVSGAGSTPAPPH